MWFLLPPAEGRQFAVCSRGQMPPSTPTPASPHLVPPRFSGRHQPRFQEGSHTEHCVCQQIPGRLHWVMNAPRKRGRLLSSTFWSFRSCLSSVNCITGQPLGFIPQTPEVCRPFPIVLCLLPLQALSGHDRMFRGGCDQGVGYCPTRPTESL